MIETVVFVNNYYLPWYLLLQMQKFLDISTIKFWKHVKIATIKPNVLKNVSVYYVVYIYVYVICTRIAHISVMSIPFSTSFFTKKIHLSDSCQKTTPGKGNSTFILIHPQITQGNPNKGNVTQVGLAFSQCQSVHEASCVANQLVPSVACVILSLCVSSLIGWKTLVTYFITWIML